MNLHILVLPGDGIGTEVTREAVRVLQHVAKKWNHSLRLTEGCDQRAINTMAYTRAEIERVSRMAFQLARGRRRKVTSVDKSNVLENSQLWRRGVGEMAREYLDVDL